MDLQAEIEKLLLEKKAKEAQEAAHEAADVDKYMQQDAKEHTMDSMQNDSDGNLVNRFKRISKGLGK